MLTSLYAAFKQISIIAAFADYKNSLVTSWCSNACNDIVASTVVTCLWPCYKNAQFINKKRVRMRRGSMLSTGEIFITYAVVTIVAFGVAAYMLKKNS